MPRKWAHANTKKRMRREENKNTKDTGQKGQTDIKGKNEQKYNRKEKRDAREGKTDKKGQKFLRGKPIVNVARKYAFRNTHT